jgi:hypothetical protein
MGGDNIIQERCDISFHTQQKKKEEKEEKISLLKKITCATHFIAGLYQDTPRNLDDPPLTPNCFSWQLEEEFVAVPVVPAAENSSDFGGEDNDAIASSTIANLHTYVGT